MSTPIRHELDLARLAARERRLRLVMQILSRRESETERAGTPAPPALRQSIAGFGEQLRDVHRRQAELSRSPEASPAEQSGRFASSSRGGRFGGAPLSADRP